MAKRFTGEKEILYVSAYSSRPLLHVKPKEKNLRPMAYTFSDALTRYGRQLRQSDLGEAYRRAGKAFTGQMQQNFVVLYEARPPGEGNYTGRQQIKRMNEGEKKQHQLKKRKRSRKGKND